MCVHAHHLQTKLVSVFFPHSYLNKLKLAFFLENGFSCFIIFRARRQKVCLSDFFFLLFVLWCKGKNSFFVVTIIKLRLSVRWCSLGDKGFYLISK